MLTGYHPSGGETAAVTDTLDVIDDRQFWIAWPQKVAVQRVGEPVLHKRYVTPPQEIGPLPVRHTRVASQPGG